MIRDQARRTPWLLVGSLLLLPAACSDGPRALPTGIVVEVTSDFETPPLDDVQLTVTGDGAALFYDQTFSLSSGSYRLPLRVGLEPQGDPNAPFQVKATGQVGGISIVERSATLHFIVGKVLFLQLPLQMVCQGHSCPGATSTCLANGSLDCVPDTVDPGELPTYHPTDGGAGSGGGGVGGGGIGGAGGRGGATGSGAAAGSGGAAGTGGAGGTGGASGTGGGGTGAAGTGGVTGAGGASGRGGTGGGAGLGGTGGAAGRGGAGGVATGGGGAGGSSGGAGRGGTGGTAGRGGAGGATGAAGTSGTGGATGAAGAGGSGGVGGRGGTSGGGGSGGAGGPAGMGGAGGTGGGGTVIALNDQLVGFWTFDAAGTSFPDYSGNANTITAVATYWTASGVDGGALDLSAPDAAVGAPASVSVNGITTAITIAVWVKPGPIGMVRTIISRYLGTGYWKLGFSDNGALRFTVGPSTLQTASAVSDPTDWTQVVATYDGATARLYVDGTMSTSANLGAISLVGGPATGGGYGPLVGGTFMDVTADTIEDYGGQLDELLLYKRALTSMEVTALARGTLPTRH